MKITLERSCFLKALTHGQSVVEMRTTVPILSHILLEASNETLKMTSTDLEVSFIESIPAKVQEAGKVTVPAHMLYDIVRKLPEGAEVELDHKDDQVSVRAGRSRFKLGCLPTDDFPVINTGALPCEFSMPASDLCHLIGCTQFAMSKEETRYYLNGIFFHAVDGKEFRAVSTDGHRLARVSIALPEGAKDMPGVIVSRKTVNQLSHLLDDLEGAVRISISKTQISFVLGNAFLIARLIDGEFPDYTRVIPQSNDKVMKFKVKSFSEAVDRVATISTDRVRGVKVNVEKGRLTLLAANTDQGTAREEIEVDYGNETIDIGFNSRYLLDVAQQIKGAEAQFIMADSNSPVIVRGVNDDSTLYVLMPMRV